MSFPARPCGGVVTFPTPIPPIREIPTVGVDPGHEGAAALLVYRRVPFAMSWAPCSERGVRAYEITCSDGETWRVPSLHGIGCALRDVLERQPEHPAAIALEGLFYEPESGYAFDAIATLIAGAGELGGPLRSLLPRGRDFDRPLARRWRPDVLGCDPFEASAKAEALAMTWCAEELRDVHSLGRLVDNPHVAEAICMAEWARLRVQPPQGVLFETGRRPRRRSARGA